jgi:hypothetical protein
MKRLFTVFATAAWLISISSTSTFAGVPLTNLEGVGGVAFNPLAYLANRSSDPNSRAGKIFGKPQIGGWRVSLDDSNIDWTTFGVADTIWNRLELSYGNEVINPESGSTIHKNNFGTKLLLFEETSVFPAISAGAIFKDSTVENGDVDNRGIDFYLVATKTITKLPVPVLLSGGVLSTKGRVTGVHGFDDKRDEVLFGNIDIIPLKNVALGLEYRQGPNYGDWKDANYWDAHLAWFVTNNLTLVLAYVNAGDIDSKSKVGLGDGIVFSAQYAF